MFAGWSYQVFYYNTIERIHTLRRNSTNGELDTVAFTYSFIPQQHMMPNIHWSPGEVH